MLSTAVRYSDKHTMQKEKTKRHEIAANLTDILITSAQICQVLLNKNDLRSTTTSGQKLLIFISFETKHFQILIFKHMFRS